MDAVAQFVPTEVLDQHKQYKGQWGKLTPAEIKVANFVADGMSDKGIAGHLGLAPKTAENHARQLLRKTGVKNQTEFAVKFQETLV